MASISYPVVLMRCGCTRSGSPNLRIARQFIDGHGGVLCDEPVEGLFLVGNDSDRELLAVPELTKPAADR